MTQYGFTGTRDGMTPMQAQAFRALVGRIGIKATLNHGGARGADMHARDIAHDRGWTVVEWMPEGSKAEDYLARNHRIVDESSLLIAAPRTAKEELRSGTWATIRYARRIGVPVVILDPGKVVNGE